MHERIYLYLKILDLKLNERVYLRDSRPQAE